MRKNSILLLIILAAVAWGSPELRAQATQGPRSQMDMGEIPPTLRPGYRDNLGNGPMPWGAVPTPYYQYNPAPYWGYMGGVLSHHIESKCKGNEGFFLIRDPLTDAKLRLQLRDLRKESLSRLDQNTFIVGSRFETEEGTPVLVDFLLKPAMGGGWYVAKSEIYKVDGVPRYEYEWNGRKWVKVAAEPQE